MSGAKILVVEDEWLVAQGISENLTDLGYEVAGMASSGEEALRLAAENQPDLVVMDILLKGDMDGIDAAEHLRRRFNMPVVFLTAYTDPHTLERAKVAEPYGYILKPFEVRELHSAIEIALYKSRAEKRLQHLTEVLRAIRNVNQLIVQEKDRGRLIQRACQLLTEGRGYLIAWIALLEEGGKVAAFAVAGEEGDTAHLRQLLQKGEMPRCSHRALQQADLLVLEDLSPANCGCFLGENYHDRGALVTQLAHQTHGQGVLGVLLPVALCRDEEELSLFQELAADLSLALYKLDLEEQEQHSQEALRASEEKFRLLVENANQIILVAQGDRIRFANPAAVEISGYSLEELTSRPFLEFVHPDDREMIIKIQTDRVQGREVPNVFYCRYLPKNGALRWAEIKTSDITWEGEPATLNCITDITEKKEMVEDLRQSEEKFRMFFEKAPIGYQSLNDQGVILDVNSTWLVTLGYTREEVMGRWVGDFLTSEYRELFPERFARLKTLGEFKEVEFDMVKKDGSVINVSLMGRIALDDEGTFKQTHCVFTDHTQRKRAEEALRESEERYRTVADFTYDMEYWLGPDKRLIYMSPSCERLTGYTREEFFRATDLLKQIVHPEDRDQFGWHIVEARACEHHLDVDFRLLHRDGREVWISHACLPVYGLDGRLLGRRVSNRDITERKRAEKELGKSEKKFSSTFQHAPVMMTLSTIEEGIYIELNEMFTRVTGFTQEEAVGRTPVELGWVTAEDRRRLIETLRREGIVKDTELKLRAKDGRTVNCLFNGVVLSMEGPGMLLSIVQDITERKRADEALWESEERFRLLVENAPDAICIQTEKRFAFLNKEGLKLFGATNEDQLLGRPLLDLIHPDYRDIVQDRMRLVNEGKAVPRMEQQYLKMDGTPIYVDVSVVSFTYHGQNGGLVFLRDITERKEAEKAKKLLEVQLFQAQKMEALGTLAGGIAHDFNNILGAMMGFVELTSLDLPENSRGRLDLQDVLKAGDRARHLVKQIMSFSRQEKADRRPRALTPIVEETLKFLRASIPTTIDIRTHLHAEKTMVVADSTQIHQVLLNLATNAAHAMAETGGRLEISLEVMQLSPEEISLYEGIAPGPCLELRVSDTGHGMEPEVLGRIFEPFFTTKEAGKGTGMGLAMVYGIIKDHGGAIRVTSQPGQGTAFQVLLPVMEVELPDAKPEVLTPFSKGEGRILFVDDDVDFFQAGQRMLRELGYKVAAFDSSLEALMEFQAQPQQFDLIVCDQTMPGLTGLELAAACSCLWPDLPIILCTGFSETVTPEKARAAGVREVVTKPFDLRQIGESIKKVLKKNITSVE